MRRPLLTVEEFRDLVDRLGEDLASWPADRRRQAKSLLRHSAEARDIVDAASRLRGLLREPAPKAPVGLADRIVAKALGGASAKGRNGGKKSH
jgi:hypothetical protein